MADVFDKAKVRIIMKEPFFANLMLNMEAVHTTVLPNGQPLWLAATDGQTLYFNIENARTLPLEQCVGLLKHELMHVALLHNFRVGSRDRQKANQAMDYVINDMIIHEKGQLPEGGLHDPGRWNRTMAWEEVYAEMPDPPKQKGSGGGQGGDGDEEQPGGSPGQGDDPFDGDVLPAPDQSAAAQQKAIGRIVKAAQVAKAMGKLPDYISEALGELLDPSVPWEQELAEFLTEVSRNDFTFARPNRRFVYQDLYLPSAYSQDAMGKLVVVFDTSGSVSMEEINRFASETVGAIEGTLPLSLVIVYCDAKVQHVDTFDAPTVEEVKASLHRHGRGGTDMTVALDYIDEHIDDVKATIIFTDGYTPFGHERDYPTLWAITTKNLIADMGRTVYVPAG